MLVEADLPCGFVSDGEATIKFNELAMQASDQQNNKTLYLKE